MPSDDGLPYAVRDADIRERLRAATKLLADARALLDGVCIVLATDDYTERRAREAYHFADRAHDCTTAVLLARDVGEGTDDDDDEG